MVATHGHCALISSLFCLYPPCEGAGSRLPGIPCCLAYPKSVGNRGTAALLVNYIDLQALIGSTSPLAKVLSIRTRWESGA
ncbi:uncharacterized protein BDZ83DRAFT_644961 [Colletotrichum acutatum]|uniref:Secreted protein n=1 Tax=Glomerella acutata TaxID=27357 RepID=A0AAD8X7V6_GLOAC|nr:uncharacterized protein BDZ83DRAFT_644961 [Colletotrichum acutatum]KAK1703246.1 hypothetical protein BDZ83DRAFT_644961 [Colletotrichum acutatum]